MKTKKNIQADLHALLFQHSKIIAAWEGGSAATGFELALKRYEALKAELAADWS